MTPKTVIRTLAFATAIVCAAPPTEAAVIQSAPTPVVFAGDLTFYPASPPALPFDETLGSLNAVTLAFDGIMTVNISGRVGVEPPLPATVTANVVVDSGLPILGVRPRAVLDPFILPVTFTERPEDTYFPYGVRGSVSEARSFELSIPGGSYGGASIRTDFRVPELRDLPIVTPASNDAIFRGIVSALFDYTPSGDGTEAIAVPEPASLAVLGLGLAGLLAARRRAG